MNINIIKYGYNFFIIGNLKILGIEFQKIMPFFNLNIMTFGWKFDTMFRKLWHFLRIKKWSNAIVASFGYEGESIISFPFKIQLNSSMY